MQNSDNKKPARIVIFGISLPLWFFFFILLIVVLLLADKFGYLNLGVFSQPQPSLNMLGGSFERNLMGGNFNSPSVDSIMRDILEYSN